MGVLGLAPFLQKTCPEVIKQLPDRLRSLTGKRVVIDGTLITQRFHFAQAPHPYRHVLGWYRLVKELQEAGVSTVCVFDGKERNVAKAREAERRKEVQRKTMARGALEQDRSKRLRKLSNILHRFKDLDTTTREHAASLLRQLSAGSKKEAPQTPAYVPTTPAHANGECQPSPIPLISRTVRFPPGDDIFRSDDIPDEVLQPIFEEGHLNLFSEPHDETHITLDSDSSPSEDSTNRLPPDHPWFQDFATPFYPDSVIDALAAEHDIYTHVSPVHIDEPYHLPTPSELPLPSILTTDAPPDKDHISGQLHTPHLPEPQQFIAEPASITSDSLPTEDNISEQLGSLYLDYRRSITQLACLAVPLGSVGDTDAQAEIVMTKAQYQLMLEEGTVWNTFTATDETVSPLAVQSTTSALEKLSQASDGMSASFERRMNPPTAQTYKECKEMLRAMGVPCLESSGAFEAEALASSMVLSGLADYVASEDTDVLVYEAPLVRNLANRNMPLTIVSGTEIRTVLRLDRASFIDFALLLGTDFSQRIKNVGPARALKFIREHGSIERVIELEKKFLPRIPYEAYLAQITIARMVFRTLPPVPDKSLLEPGEVNEVEIMTVLQRYGLDRAVASSVGWDYTSALKGNYFNDNPSAG